jgi:hypothetical protein
MSDLYGPIKPAKPKCWLCPKNIGIAPGPDCNYLVTNDGEDDLASETCWECGAFMVECVCGGAHDGLCVGDPFHPKCVHRPSLSLPIKP